MRLRRRVVGDPGVRRVRHLEEAHGGTRLAGRARHGVDRDEPGHERWISAPDAEGDLAAVAVADQVVAGQRRVRLDLAEQRGDEGHVVDAGRLGRPAARPAVPALLVAGRVDELGIPGEGEGDQAVAARLLVGRHPQAVQHHERRDAGSGWVGRQEGHVRSRQSHDGDGLGSLGEAGGDRRGWARRGRRGACRPAGRGARVGCALSHREARRLTLIEARHRQDGQPHHDDQATCDRGSL